MLSVTFYSLYCECHNAECRYAECHYAECHHGEGRSAVKKRAKYAVLTLLLNQKICINLTDHLSTEKICLFKRGE